MIAESERPTARTIPAGTGKASTSGKKRGRPKRTEGAATPKSYLVIDHPQNGENIGHPHHYAIRIGAGGGEAVEISIDNGGWHACRHSAGYYWYDWHSIPKGTHKIIARMKLPNSKIKKSKITRCTVS